MVVFTVQFAPAAYTTMVKQVKFENRLAESSVYGDFFLGVWVFPPVKMNINYEDPILCPQTEFEYVAADPSIVVRMFEYHPLTQCA